LVRDSAGRIYQERRLVPKSSQQEPDLQRSEISDPFTHKKYFCRTETRVCISRITPGLQLHLPSRVALRKTASVL
jgi:hypothetical protein